jgi:peptidoglycan/LPS O-acetylase OafA/YrhL
MSILYRPEIDGLRAVAVVPVILFHASFGLFSGGFVGVDVFFVISGYLITVIILAELERGSFSLRGFYERRARRLLPALFVVLAACLPFAHLWMLPEQFREFSRAMISVVLFASNIYFWRNTDYFSPTAEENPLLHTWSLAIEEQFYIFYPLLLLLLWRSGRVRIFVLLVLATAASFALAHWGAYRYPGATFFLLPTRAWELGVGGICAFLLHGRARQERPLLALLGLGLILCSVFAFNAETPFPSAYALLPVGGAALIILYGGSTGLAGRLLASAPLVGIGLISYSAYLWHQPLFAFARVRVSSHPDAALLLLLCVVTLVLAYGTWRLVEQPFRSRPVPVLPGQRSVFATSAAGFAVFATVGLWGEASEGRRSIWAQQNPEQAKLLTLYEEAVSIRGVFLDDGGCRFNQHSWSAALEARILACSEMHGPALVILGDSHSIDFFNGLFVASDVPFLLGLTSTCRADEVHSRVECRHYSDFASFLSTHPETVRQVVYTEAGVRLIGPGGIDASRSLLQQLPEDEPLKRDDLFLLGVPDAIVHYLDELAVHTSVLWLGPRVEPHIKLSYILANGCDHDFALRPGLMTLYQEVDEKTHAAIVGTAINYFSQIDAAPLSMPDDYMDCGVLYWRDGDHWSKRGAALFVARLLEHPDLAAAVLSQ